jgi:hypothetical protein
MPDLPGQGNHQGVDVRVARALHHPQARAERAVLRFL